MKVGILSSAHMHAGAYVMALKRLGNVEIVGIADEDENRGREFANTHNIEYFKDYREFLKMDMDAVIICSENVRHCEMTVEAARCESM